MFKKVKIDGRTIGRGEKCYIIAEIGSNHNRDMKIAKKLVDVSVSAGVDAVKFQSFTIDNWLSKDFLDFPTMDVNGEELRACLKECELDHEMFKEIYHYCREKGVTCFSTPSHIEDIRQLEEIDIPAYKFGSVQITDFPTIYEAVQTGKPVMISTGASSLVEVMEVYDVLTDKDIILLHCTSCYPSNFDEINLNVLDLYHSLFDCPIGYSDHTVDPCVVPIAAVAKGACIIEKHITLNKKMKGPDHPFAIEPGELNRMVEVIRTVEKVLGKRNKLVLEREKQIAAKGRRSIVAAKSIKKGKAIERNYLTTKRPGTGVPPKYIDLLVGKKAKKDIEGDSIITWDMLL
jgi:N-acetylneuraminate synthase/N,N'-diacetyllegionaminate synthase